MNATDIKVGSIIKTNFLKSKDGIGTIIDCTDNQITIEQKHETVSVVNNLGSGRVLKLKQLTKKVSRSDFQKVLDGKNKYATAEIISI